MTDTELNSLYKRWLECATKCSYDELTALADDTDALKDAFYRDLAFGTGGLRGIIGVGPNRMNIYTVSKATQGLADYLNAHYDAPSVAIARDSRLCGWLFMRTSAQVLAANGIRALLYPRIEPTPALSFAVRDLGCSAGINITASHNPSEYSGYKVYGCDGCQITTDTAAEIQRAIDKVDVFDDVKHTDFYDALHEKSIAWIGEQTLDHFLDAVAAQSVECPSSSEPAVTLSVVYTPLNGTGLECFMRIAGRMKLGSISVVPEQAEPDGRFPTCPYPNPEIREALERALALSERVHPDLVLATDPDADRCGIAVPDKNGVFQLVTGNELGILLLDYICRMRLERKEDLSCALVVTTIVSTTMVDALAAHYGFELRRTLTGFKFIGEQIGLLEDGGETERFIFGFEESYGYLSGSHVRDKDAINAGMLVCQMARRAKAEGISLLDMLTELYEKYGYYVNETVSIAYPGAAGARQIEDIMKRLRKSPPTKIADLLVERVVDYASGQPMPIVNPQEHETVQILPQADVVEFKLARGNKIIIRPSGTEPKIKAYIFTKGANEQKAATQLSQLSCATRTLLQ